MRKRVRMCHRAQRLPANGDELKKRIALKGILFATVIDRLNTFHTGLSHMTSDGACLIYPRTVYKACRKVKVVEK